MNLQAHRRTISRASGDLRTAILDYFKLPHLRDPLTDILMSVNLGQADLVLCLLRINTREALRLAERVVGKRITICPPCLRFARARPPRALPGKDERVITWVGENKFNGGRAHRFSLLRPGMLLSQYVARGGRKRDVRVALSRGLVRVEMAA